MDNKTPPPSPPSSSFVPLSLVETLTRPNRTLNSSRTARPSHSHHPSLVVTNKEKAEAAKREAQALCASLGIATEGGPSLGLGAGANSDATPRPGRVIAGNSLKLMEEEGEGNVPELKKELGQLRRTVLDQKKEIVALRKKVAALEVEKPKSLSGEALGARDLEVLAKSFEDQENLLAGYQRDSEKTHLAMENLRAKNRKLVEHLQKLYGPGWEESELDALPSHSTSFDGHSSPSLLQKLSARSTSINKSGLVTPTGLGRIAKESSSSINTDAGLDSSTELEVLQVVDSPSPSPTNQLHPPLVGQERKEGALSREALENHLNSVQMLLRGVERQMIAREVELEALEKKAKGEAEKAHKKEKELADKSRRLVAA